jgi:hypothetical protein
VLINRNNLQQNTILNDSRINLRQNQNQIERSMPIQNDLNNYPVSQIANIPV